MRERIARAVKSLQPLCCVDTHELVLLVIKDTKRTAAPTQRERQRSSETIMSIVVGSRTALGPSWNASVASSSASPLHSRAFVAPSNRPSQSPRWPSCAVDAAREPAKDSSEHSLGIAAGEGRKPLASSSSLAQEGSFVAPGTEPISIREWELDFCSRPILDARGKRIWELLVCDSKRRLQVARFYPNNMINSVTLKDAIVSIMQTLGLPRPQKIRFFRSQIQNIVSKACAELDVQAVPSRRCISLVRWLNERYESVYQQHPGFQEGASPLLQLEQSFPLELPDSLRGEQWAFVQLPLPGVLEEVAAVERGSTFGNPLSLDVLGLDLPSNAVIPGVAVASTRATPLAAWTNTLELASLEVDRSNACVVLSTGVSDRWLYAFYRKNRKADQEAEAWEATKRACGGLHFLAVQQSLDSDFCTGFWLLFDGPQSRV